MTGAPSLAVVVPVYNEGATIETGLRAITDVVARVPGRSIAVAVDDGSADDSRAILKRLYGELEGLHICLHERNAGYGAALRTGAAWAHEQGFDYAAFIDSDLTNPPEDLLVMARLAAEGHRYIKASRFCPGGSMASVPLRRRAVSVLGNRVGALLAGAGITDVTNGFRAVHLDDWAQWQLTETDFSSIVEELGQALRHGVRPVEFPSVLTARTSDQRVSAFPYTARLVARYLAHSAGARRSPSTKRN